MLLARHALELETGRDDQPVAAQRPSRFHALSHGIEKFRALRAIDDAATRIYAEARQYQPGFIERLADGPDRLVAPQMEFHAIQAALRGLVNALSDVAGFVGEQPLDTC